MRTVAYDEIVSTTKRLCMEASVYLGSDVMAAIKSATERETSPLGKQVLAEILDNNTLAAREVVPICQDTGTAVVFIELGQDAHVTGGALYDAINKGIREGYADGYLRKSIVADPLRRKNTGDNTPAVIHLDITPGDRIRLAILPKGGGAENMSRAVMLTPADGEKGVRAFVVETVELAGSNACPPVIVGVGIGGTFDTVGTLAKKALLRKVGERHPDPYYAAMEEGLLKEINALGVGPMGYGGNVTALDVHVETAPCHIASLPAAVNLQCHAARIARAEL